MVIISKHQIAVVGYPRSGTAWIARLLGDALNSPVGGVPGINAIAAEGLDRTGDYQIYQRHATPCSDSRHKCQCEKDASAWTICVNSDIQVVHIVRSPLDIAVSTMFFYGISLDKAIDQMSKPHSEGYLPNWEGFIRAWNGQNAVCIKYENLLSDTLPIMKIVLSRLGCEIPSNLYEICTRQSFSVKRAQIEQDGDTRPYGKQRQLEHIRRGTSGEWREHFEQWRLNRAKPVFEAGMAILGYVYPERAMK